MEDQSILNGADHLRWSGNETGGSVGGISGNHPRIDHSILILIKILNAETGMALLNHLQFFHKMILMNVSETSVKNWIVII